MMKAKTRARWALFGIVLLVATAAAFSVHTMVSVEDAQTITGAKTFKSINNERWADGFAGADWVAKLNAADADLGSTAGTIYVGSAIAGSATTALSLQSTAKRNIVFMPGTFTTSANPLAFPPNVSVAGILGRQATTIKCTAAADCFQMTSSRGSYVTTGSIQNLSIAGGASATVGIHFQNRELFHISNVMVGAITGQGGFTQQCILLDAVLTAKVEHALMTGCGDATHAQLDITGAQNDTANPSTTVYLDDVRIDSGNSTTVAGLDIDRASDVSVKNFVSESTGCPIRIGSKADNISRVQEVSVETADLENPNSSGTGTSCDHYIEAGYGWTGAAFQAYRNLSIKSITTSVSGSTSVKYGIKLANGFGFSSENASWSLSNLGGTPITYGYWFEGTTNDDWHFDGSNRMSLVSGVTEFMSVNGLNDRQGNSRTPYYSNGIQIHLFRGTEFATTVPSGTANIDVGATSYVITLNSTPTTVTNFTNNTNEPPGGQLLYVRVADANTTFKNAAGGVGAICATSGADIAAANGHIYAFIYDDQGAHCWRQVLN